MCSMRFPWKYRILISILLASGSLFAGYQFYKGRLRDHGIFITGAGDTITIFEWKTPNSHDEAVITQKSIDGIRIGRMHVGNLGSYYPSLEAPRFKIESGLTQSSPSVLPRVDTRSIVRSCNGWFEANEEPISIQFSGQIWRLETGRFLLFHGDNLSILDGRASNTKVLSTVARNLPWPVEVCRVLEPSEGTFVVYSRMLRPNKAYDELGSFAELVKTNDGQLEVLQAWVTERSVDSTQLTVLDERVYYITADGRSIEQRRLNDGQVVSSSSLPFPTDIGWEGSPYCFTACGTVLELSANSRTSKKWFSLVDLSELQIPKINGASKLVYCDYNKSSAWLYNFDSQELLICNCQQATIDHRVSFSFPVFRFALTSDRKNLIAMGVDQEDRWKVIPLDGTATGKGENGLRD